MNQKIISAALAVIMLLSCVSFAFADAQPPAAGAPIKTSEAAVGVPTKTSEAAAGAPIRLSLAEAVKTMQTTGTKAETAKINKQADLAIAAGYCETVDTIKSTLDKLDAIQATIHSMSGIPQYAPQVAALNAAYWSATSMAQEQGATGVNEKIMRLRRDFAKEQVDSNYQAEMNQIEYTTVQTYYGVLLATDQLKIALDNVAAQQDILKNAQAQYRVGMVAKTDVLSAQAALETARSDLQAAKTKLQNGKMGLNFLMGYSVLQEVILSDSLKEVTAPAIAVEAAVSDAQAKRNEIRGANFAKNVHGILLENLKYQYPSNSSVYLNQQVAYLNAEKTAKDAPRQIEIDIRGRLSTLMDLKAAVASAKTTRSYAEEGYRLMKLSYEAGMCTLAELQQMQVTSYKANLGVAAAVTNYDLAVYDFGYATGVGTARLPL